MKVTKHLFLDERFSFKVEVEHGREGENYSEGVSWECFSPEQRSNVLGATLYAGPQRLRYTLCCGLGNECFPKAM